ncbi:hypothetical protein [Deinococcus roseus]|uniref:AraC-type arabinose-binding/dimerisation domain-containing protein n=1 Tax=Deinococcus roseus TaxID=392414 RepID=A0ABQ2DBJ3_9DEIO|nr:hypothetical protein [Deinococcus roseus]GGJ52660.1 hypothetical protein GCM10008938_43270 [Deinococcus roseus]
MPTEPAPKVVTFQPAHPLPVRLGVVRLYPQHASLQDRPHYRQFHSLVLITARAGHHRINGQQVPVQAGQLFRIGPRHL